MVELVRTSLHGIRNGCKMVVDEVNKNKLNHSEYGMIFQDCKIILMDHNRYKVVLTRHQANCSTHTLAQTFLSYASHNLYNIIPNYVATILITKSHKQWQSKSKFYEGVRYIEK